MPESIPATLIIDVLKDTFREARAALAAEAPGRAQPAEPLGWILSVPDTHQKSVLAALDKEYQQLAHIAEPRVVAGKVAPPGRSIRDARVDRCFRLVAAGRPCLGEAAIPEFGRARTEPPRAQRRV